MTRAEVIHADCLDALRLMPDNSIDAIVTDPPYGLSFMGKKWDYDVPSEAIWRECLRVLKPGGHLLAFAGTRTQHRMAVRIEDAGFEIRDMIAWVYGSGFPKSLDVSKAIDKRGGNAGLAAEIGQALKAARTSRGVSVAKADALFCGGSTLYSWYEGRPAGQQMPTGEFMGRIAAAWPELQPYAEQIQAAEREVVGQRTTGIGTGKGTVAIMGDGSRDLTAPATEAAQQWQGWGTSLKPSHEPLTVAVKPYTDEQERDTIGANLSQLEARLWLLSCANAAEKNLTSSPEGYAEACASAHWTADDVNSTRDALSEAMGTSLFASALNISLNTVSSWRHTWAEAWNPGNTFTTETALKMTTDLRILKFSLSQITPDFIIQANSLQSGQTVPVSHAGSLFVGFMSLLKNTLALSAVAPAISQAAESYRAGDVRPALEPITVARKPFAGTVAGNVQQWGTGALNIDGCRVESGADYHDLKVTQGGNRQMSFGMNEREFAPASGRWPANLIHDGSAEVLAGFPETQSTKCNPETCGGDMGNAVYGQFAARTYENTYADSGSAARFFYCAKSSKKDRGEGNTHPTVKPTDLMRYLCRLVTPPGGTVLDPFAGSGSTGKAAILEGFSFVGIERDEDSVTIARRRIAEAQGTAPLYAGAEG